MRKAKSLADKEDVAIDKKYAWDSGYHAGRLYQMEWDAWMRRNTAAEPPKEPKNPWHKLIKHYIKRWKHGERYQ